MNASPQASWQDRNLHRQQHHKILTTTTTKQLKSSTYWPASTNSARTWRQQHLQPSQARRASSLAGYSSSTGGSQISECHGGVPVAPIDASHAGPRHLHAAACSNSPTYLRSMRAPSSQLYGPDSALLAAGGHRMALKLASPAAASSRWPHQHPAPPPQQQQHLNRCYATNGVHPVASECRGSECCGTGDCSSDLVELLSDCSCSESLDFQCPAANYHQQYPQQSPHHQHLSSRRPVSEQQQQSNEPAGARYVTRYSPKGAHSRSPTPPPPAPPPPPPPQPLLLNRNTYTTTAETFTDSQLLANPHDAELCQQAPVHLHRQTRSNSIETDPLIEELAPQHHKHSIGHTMSLGRANHLHHNRHQHQHLMNAEFVHKPVLQVNKRQQQQQQVSFRRGNNLDNCVALRSPAALQPLDNASAVQQQQHQSPASQWTPDHLNSNIVAGSPRQQLDYSRHQQLNRPRQTGSQKKLNPSNRNNNGIQMNQSAAINQLTNEASPVSLASQQSPNARAAPTPGQQEQQQQQQQQQQQISSIALYPANSPLGAPLGAAQDLQQQPPIQLSSTPAPLGRSSTAHLLSGSGAGVMDGPAPVLQLQPVTTSHRNYAHWMRVSSIVLTPVGLIIILFIVVSPLLHYLM